MAGTAEKTDPALWEKVKAEVTAGTKGGDAGEWSARKAQLAVHQYKAAGGGYKGRKDPHNHLAEWTHEEWGTKSGQPSHDTGERYLPKAARNALTDSEYKRTSDKKRADTRKGRQFSAQPKDVAAKAGTARKRAAGEPTLAELRKKAAAKGVAGRSRMNKAQLMTEVG